MTTIASGVIMRISDYDFAVYPDRTQREVHLARRHESITYRIESDGRALHRVTPQGDSWEHYRYRFHYRHQGRTFSITWMCGTGYGDPKPIDGLQSAFLDASTVEWEAFGPSWMGDFGYDLEDYPKARRIYRACVKVNERLDAFLGDERDNWQQATREK